MTTSQMTLSQAPAGLRVAVRRMLGSATTPAGSAFQQAKLTASDAATQDWFGSAVAIYGSTAVIGAYTKNSSTGAAYVFIRSGTTWVQQQKLTAPDGAAGDDFGVSVAIYGSTAVIGAKGKNSKIGAAYVFIRSGATWTVQQELVASGPPSSDEFGDSVAIYGSTALVGAYGNRGQAYVFVRSGSTWTQQQKLTAPDTGVQFGVSVALYNSTAVVGEDVYSSQVGAAYVYVRAGSVWTEQGKLTASDGVAGDFFGYDVAIYGSTVFVGVPARNSYTGAAYIFGRSGTSWSQRAELIAPDGAPHDWFGSAVAIYGSTAVIGAYHDTSTFSADGAAYVFARAGAQWYLQSKLTTSDAAAGDELGVAAAIYGSTALVGAFGKNSGTGAAYVYALPHQQAELTASDAAAADQLGYSVAVAGSTAVAGAYAKSADTGAAYVFVRSGSSWSQQAKLTASDAAIDDFFGASVAISGTTVVVGAPDKNSGVGAAYVFVRSGSTWSQQAKLTASDGAANDGFGGSVAVYGSTVLVGAAQQNGSGVGAAYVFVRSGSTWSQQAKLTASDPGTGDFGFSVGVYGSTAVVGAPNLQTAGLAYVFVRVGSSWSQQAKLTASDGAAGDQFGASAAIYGPTVVIGAPQKNSQTGAAYVFSQSGTVWSQQAELVASDAASGDDFGGSVSIQSSTVAIGAPLKNSDTGAAYLFAGSGSNWPQQAELRAPDASTNTRFGWSVAISGSTAAVTAPDKNSQAGAAYTFGSV